MMLTSSDAPDHVASLGAIAMQLIISGYSHEHPYEAVEVGSVFLSPNPSAEALVTTS